MGYFFVILSLIFSLFLSSILYTANAIPAFARQMGVSCMACHSQSQFPTLNRFGRKFKASGYTMVGNRKLIEEKRGKSTFLSIPDVLNASILANFAYSKTGGETGEFAIPDELALLIGGRISKNVGTFVEIGYETEGDGGFGLGNLKVPIVFDYADNKVGIVPFSTDGMGPSFAFEVLSTGAVENQKVNEKGEIISAQQYIGTATTASGLGLYFYNDLYHVVYAAWAPEHNISRISSPAHYLRFAFTPQYGSWDIGIGGQLWFGKAKLKGEDSSISSYKANAYALDFQAMGNVGRPLTLILTYGNAKNEANSLFNTGTDNKKAITLLAEVGIVPDRLLASVAYRNATDENGDSDNAEMIGLKYMLNRNVQIQIDYAHLNNQPEKNDFLFLLSSAF